MVPVRYKNLHFHPLFPSSQLQLQRNEVIALVNLLNRLSESINFVREVSPLVEKTMERLLSEPLTEDISLWRRIREAIGGGFRYITAAPVMFFV